MKKLSLGILLMLPLSILAIASDAPVVLEKVSVDLNNRVSISRGAKFFANNCMVCHSMKYLQHNKIAAQAGITLDKMPLKSKEWWLGIVPPDLTLIAAQRSPRWLYTYFHSFYKDASRPTGYNNLLVKDVNMINVFVPMQGVQEILPRYAKDLHENGYSKPHYYSVLQLVKSGSMTPEQFDETMTDLVNFLVYASDPNRLFRERIGVWVLLFLAVFFVLAYLLKKLYWKKVK